MSGGRADGKAMKPPAAIPAILVAFALAGTGARAQEPATTIATGGSGELRRVAELMADPQSPALPASLPATVSAGEVIAIRYRKAGATLDDSFRVTGITIAGDRCSIESKHNNADGRELVDTLLVSPCTRLK